MHNEYEYQELYKKYKNLYTLFKMSAIFNIILILLFELALLAK